MNLSLINKTYKLKLDLYNVRLSLTIVVIVVVTDCGTNQTLFFSCYNVELHSIVTDHQYPFDFSFNFRNPRTPFAIAKKCYKNNCDSF